MQSHIDEKCKKKTILFERSIEMHASYRIVFQNN